MNSSETKQQKNRSHDITVDKLFSVVIRWKRRNLVRFLSNELRVFDRIFKARRFETHWRFLMSLAFAEKFAFIHLFS